MEVTAIVYHRKQMKQVTSPVLVDDTNPRSIAFTLAQVIEQKLRHATTDEVAIEITVKDVVS